METEREQLPQHEVTISKTEWKMITHLYGEDGRKKLGFLDHAKSLWYTFIHPIAALNVAKLEALGAAHWGRQLREVIDLSEEELQEPPNQARIVRLYARGAITDHNLEVILSDTNSQQRATARGKIEKTVDSFLENPPNYFDYVTAQIEASIRKAQFVTKVPLLIPLYTALFASIKAVRPDLEPLETLVSPLVLQVALTGTLSVSGFIFDQLQDLRVSRKKKGQQRDHETETIQPLPQAASELITILRELDNNGYSNNDGVISAQATIPYKKAAYSIHLFDHNLQQGSIKLDISKQGEDPAHFLIQQGNTIVHVPAEHQKDNPQQASQPLHTFFELLQKFPDQFLIQSKNAVQLIKWYEAYCQRDQQIS